jgi:hypothetical protein
VQHVLFSWCFAVHSFRNNKKKTKPRKRWNRLSLIIMITVFKRYWSIYCSMLSPGQIQYTYIDEALSCNCTRYCLIDCGLAFYDIRYLNIMIMKSQWCYIAQMVFRKLVEDQNRPRNNWKCQIFKVQSFWPLDNVMSFSPFKLDTCAW